MKRRAALLGLTAFGLSGAACSLIIDADEMRKSTDPVEGSGGGDASAVDAAEAGAVDEDWSTWPEIFRDNFAGVVSPSWRSEVSTSEHEVSPGGLTLTAPGASPGGLRLDLDDPNWRAFSVEYDLAVTSQTGAATARVNPISFGTAETCILFVKVSTIYGDGTKAPGPALDFPAATGRRVSNWGGDVSAPLNKARASAKVRIGIDLTRNVLRARIAEGSASKEVSETRQAIPASCRGSVVFHAGLEVSADGSFTVEIRNFAVRAVH